jgi:hypothetical protein
MMTYKPRLREGTETCSHAGKPNYRTGNVDRQREWTGRKIRQSEGKGRWETAGRFR